jgi:hypothetical protein
VIAIERRMETLLLQHGYPLSHADIYLVRLYTVGLANFKTFAILTSTRV